MFCGRERASWWETSMCVSCRLWTHCGPPWAAMPTHQKTVLFQVIAQSDRRSPPATNLYIWGKNNCLSLPAGKYTFLPAIWRTSSPSTLPSIHSHRARRRVGALPIFTSRRPLAILPSYWRVFISFRWWPSWGPLSSCASFYSSCYSAYRPPA